MSSIKIRTKKRVRYSNGITPETVYDVTFKPPRNIITTFGQRIDIRDVDRRRGLRKPNGNLS